MMKGIKVTVRAVKRLCQAKWFARFFRLAKPLNKMAEGKMCIDDRLGWNKENNPTLNCRVAFEIKLIALSNLYKSLPSEGL